MKLFEYFTEQLENYVRKEEFNPVKSLVFGMVGIILTAFIVAITTLIFKK